jgi:hypothetical protein
MATYGQGTGYGQGGTSKNPYWWSKPLPVDELLGKNKVTPEKQYFNSTSTVVPVSKLLEYKVDPRRTNIQGPSIAKAQAGTNQKVDSYTFVSDAAANSWLNNTFNLNTSNVVGKKQATPNDLRYFKEVQSLVEKSADYGKMDGIQQRALKNQIEALPQDFRVLYSLIKENPNSDYNNLANQTLQKGIAAIPEAEKSAKTKLAVEKASYDDLAKQGVSLRPQSPASTVAGVVSPVVVKALAPEQKVGGTKTVITNPTGTSFVESTQNGPRISVATQTAGTRTSTDATNITPIVDYKEAPEGSPPIFNQLLVDNAKKLQEMLTAQLLGNIYNGTSTQTTRPKYSLDEKGITAITPINPVTDEQIKEKAARDIEEQKFNNQKFVDYEKYKADLKMDEQKQIAKKKEEDLIYETKQSEANALREKQADEERRRRAQNQFDYDSQIEAALRAASGNSSLARRQFAANDARQRAMDAEELARRNAKKGNPSAYAGGFAEQAIQTKGKTPEGIKIPAQMQPKPPAPVTPLANNVDASSLLPKIDGLQFGGN